MARRYSGHIRVDIRIEERHNAYACKLVDGQTGERATVAVLFPGVITAAVDSPDAYDAAARAALAFADVDEEIDADHAAFMPDGSGFHVGRSDDKCWPAAPPCAAAMGCLCAGHARGNAADAPCDTRE